MSWDVMVFNIGGSPPPPIEELREEALQPLGPADEVRTRISAHLNGMNWSDPTWGLFAGEGFSIEFNVGRDDPIKNIMLHVRGGGDAIAAIVQFARPLSWALLDCSTCKFLDFDNPLQDGWEGFQAFRDKAIGRLGDNAG